jgi:hypothetical protein
MGVTKGDIEELSEAELLDALAEEYRSRDSKQFKVLSVLVDRNWHCRSHEYDHVESDQIAGGGGIQGLERGTKTRPGFEIESEDQHCDTCGETTRHDRWTGERKTANAAANIPEAVKQKILDHYDHRDVIEDRQRQLHDLVIDHRFPMERWAGAEESYTEEIDESEIERTFQLLKDDGKGNHNLLKSRACEHCKETGERGAPMGIEFWYRGGPEWPDDVPEEGPEAEVGCVGCGWYNFDRWRQELNELIRASATFTERIDVEGTLLDGETSDEAQLTLEDTTD